MRPEVRGSLISVVVGLAVGCAGAPAETAEVGAPNASALVQQFDNPDDAAHPLISESTASASAYDAVLSTSQGEVLFLAHFDLKSRILSFSVQTDGNDNVLSEGSVAMGDKPLDAAGMNLFANIGYLHTHSALQRNLSIASSLPRVGKDVPYQCGRMAADPEWGQCTYSWDGPYAWNWTSGQWQGCCVTHDQQYANGGDGNYKNAIDSQLWNCINSHGGNSFVGGVYYAAVTAFGYQYYNYRC